jgi:ribosomal protein S21
MINVTRKEQESSTALVRRFMQRVQASGVLKEAKRNKFFKKETNRTLRRAEALEREKKRAHYAKLRKLGKTKEPQRY